MKAQIPPVVIENADIWMSTRNFSGQPNRFGDTTPGFCVFLESDLAEAMSADGWNVRMTRPNDNGEARPYIAVAFRYDVPERLRPKIWRKTSKNTILMTENTVGSLDRDDFNKVDLVINPSYWEKGKDHGIKAYVKDMFVTVEENPLYSKYFPEEPVNSMLDEDLPF